MRLLDSFIALEDVACQQKWLLEHRTQWHALQLALRAEIRLLMSYHNLRSPQKQTALRDCFRMLKILQRLQSA